MIKFSDLKLDPKVLKAITEAGYDKPTPIQAGAIPPALEGRDVLGIAQTGTGKTASFTLPVITLLGRGRARARMPRSLVLAPTRELAAQVAENFDIYAKHTRLTKALLIGGVSFAEQDKLIDRGVDVLIATPGRLLDHFERGKLLLTGVQIMVVDEADRMLDMGFIPDIERIFQLTPFTRQTLFFSATMAPEIERITDTFLHSPERIEVARQATASENIKQLLIEVTPTRKDQTAKQKREILRAIIDAEGDKLTNAMIFCNRKTDVDILSKSLRTHGYNAAPIHGDLDQSQRTRTLEDFRDGKLRFLVASDVAARGLDIPAVSHVFNFDLPSHAEDYVHRIGRTGRAGRKGAAISIATPLDEKYLTAIEGLLKQSLPRGEIPEDFTLTAAAQNAPRKPSPRAGTRNGTGRDRRPHAQTRDHDQNETQATTEKPAQQQAPAPVTAPVPEWREAARPDQTDTNNGQRRERRSGDRHQDRRRSGDHHAVRGMGDHVPDFMLRCFRPEVIASEAADKTEAPIAPIAVQPVENPEPAPNPTAAHPQPGPVATIAPIAETVVEPAVTAQPESTPVSEQATAPTEDATAAQQDSPAEAPVAKKAPARRRSRAAAKPVTEPETPATDTATDQPVAEPAPDAEPPATEPAKPVRKRATRARKAPAAKETETAAGDTEAQVTAQATDAEKTAPTASEATAEAVEAPVKPVRRRAPRKTTTASTADTSTEQPAKAEKSVTRAKAKATVKKPTADQVEE